MKSINPKLKVISENLIYIPLLWIATAMFWLERGDKILLIIVAICALTSLCINKTEIVRRNWTKQPWLKWLVVLILFGVASDVYHGFGSRELRALETSLILLLFLDVNTLKLKYTSILLLIAAISSSLIAYYFQFIEPTDRRIWPVNAIPFASYITLIIGLSLTLTKYSQSKLVLFTLASGAAIGLAGLFLTESRGPLLALCCTLGLFAFFSIVKGRVNWKVTAGCMVIGIVIIVLSRSVLEERYDKTKHEVQSILNGNPNTSIGLRLTVYGIGLDMILDKPILGYGKSDLKERWDQMLKNKEINRAVHRVLSWNFHNNFIEKGVASGLVGIATMFLWLGLPIVYAWRYYREHLILVATPPLLYFFACVTDTPATNGSSYVTYLVFVGLILARVGRCSNQQSSTNKESAFA